MRPLLLDLNNHTEPAIVDAADAELVSGKTFYLGTNGYVYYSKWENGRSIPRTLHSLIVGVIPGRHVDHRNRNKLDNRRRNLKIATYQQNQVNRKPNPSRGVAKTNQSRVKPWRAQIMVDHKGIHLGLFATRQEAVAARVAAELRYFGEECPR